MALGNAVIEVKLVEQPALIAAPAPHHRVALSTASAQSRHREKRVGSPQTRGGLTSLGLLYNHFIMEPIGYTHQPQNLDAVFAALADPTRRAILLRLAAGEASVSELAAPFEISQPAVSKHLKVLERAGLVERDVDKQRRPARLKCEPMVAAVLWFEEFRQFWSSSFDQLDGLLDALKETGTRGAANE